VSLTSDAVVALPGNGQVGAPLEVPPLEVPPLEVPPLEVPPLEVPPLEVPPLEVPPPPPNAEPAAPPAPDDPPPPPDAAASGLKQIGSKQTSPTSQPIPAVHGQPSLPTGQLDDEPFASDELSLQAASESAAPRIAKTIAPRHLG